MTDLPVFTAADGLATLILHEIPAKREAYILVRTVFGTLDGLLRECAAFCRGAGAEHVYAGGAADFSGYPVFVRLIERSAEFPAPAQTDCAVEPVTQDTLLALASLVPGAGERTLLTLVRHCGLQRVELVCAVENPRAMALYDRLHFSRGKLRQSWYCVE